MTLNESMQVITAALTAEFAETVEMTPASIFAELDADETRQVLHVCLEMLAACIEMQAEDYETTPFAFLQSLGRVNAMYELP